MIRSMSHPTTPPLDEQSLSATSHELARREPFFATVVQRHGPPPLWARPPGFSTLIWIILEQQVSLASARAAFDKVRERLAEFNPQAFLALSNSELRSAGFSRQKTAYARGLAEALIAGRLDLERLDRLDDQTARAELMQIKGIGRWTADVYLLMALRRPDIWPVGDLALVTAVHRAFDLPAPPGADEMQAIGAPWKPYRAVAARLLWQYYIHELQPSKRRTAETSPQGIESERQSHLDSPETRAKL